jgi:hypothetical protein
VETTCSVAALWTTCRHTAVLLILEALLNVIKNNDTMNSFSRNLSRQPEKACKVRSEMVILRAGPETDTVVPHDIA